MKKLILAACVAFSLAGCGSESGKASGEVSASEEVRAEQKVEQLGEGVYSLEYSGDYKLDDFISAQIKDRESFDKWLCENLTNGVSTESSDSRKACSCFFAPDTEGEHLFGRNYDMYPSGAMFIKTQPENGFASIGIVDFLHLNVGENGDNPIDPEQAGELFNAAPYIIIDGLNEKGLGVSLLTVDYTDHVVNDTEKPDMLVYSALRVVLDKCADVDEAVKLLDSYDMYSPSKYTYHMFLTDKSGKSVVVEWLDGETHVVEDNAVTNIALYGCEAPEK